MDKDHVLYWVKHRYSYFSDEKYRAVLIAYVLLEKSGIDPDSDMAVLARQFINSIEQEREIDLRGGP